MNDRSAAGGTGDGNDQQKNWCNFFRLLRQAYSDELYVPLLQQVTTADEREAVVTCIHIIQALLAGDVSQRELKNELRTGMATISRGSNSLKAARRS
ncbi:MAG: DNA-binding transcriptional repressor TrpR [Sodalis sp. Fle]|nr:MAG: DNA-binding transcriptional repressor TrpR [Sodalis sp. Fle]